MKPLDFLREHRTLPSWDSEQTAQMLWPTVPSALCPTWHRVWMVHFSTRTLFLLVFELTQCSTQPRQSLRVPSRGSCWLLQNMEGWKLDGIYLLLICYHWKFISRTTQWIPFMFMFIFIIFNRCYCLKRHTGLLVGRATMANYSQIRCSMRAFCNAVIWCMSHMILVHNWNAVISHKVISNSGRHVDDLWIQASVKQTNLAYKPVQAVPY